MSLALLPLALLTVRWHCWLRGRLPPPQLLQLSYPGCEVRCCFPASPQGGGGHSSRSPSLPPPPGQIPPTARRCPRVPRPPPLSSPLPLPCSQPALIPHSYNHRTDPDPTPTRTSPAPRPPRPPPPPAIAAAASPARAAPSRDEPVDQRAPERLSVSVLHVVHRPPGCRPNPGGAPGLPCRASSRGRSCAGPSPGTMRRGAVQCSLPWHRVPSPPLPSPTYGTVQLHTARGSSGHWTKTQQQHPDWRARLPDRTSPTSSGPCGAAPPPGRPRAHTPRRSVDYILGQALLVNQLLKNTPPHHLPQPALRKHVLQLAVGRLHPRPLR